MPYNVGDTLKKCRNNAHMSVKQISDILTQKGFKASESTIYSWENDNSQPTPGALLAMCKEYGVTDVLSTFGYDGYNDDGSIQLSLKEISFIEDYRLLDSFGQETVNLILKRELERKEQSKVVAAEIYNTSDSLMRFIQYYRKVSAGTGEVIYEDTLPEQITIPAIPEYRRVAYAVKVDGRSMEPRYNDGDMLLIEPTCSIDVGEIGIFNVDGRAYVKKLGETELISLNKGYKNIPLTHDSRCMGRVIDKLTV